MDPRENALRQHIKMIDYRLDTTNAVLHPIKAKRLKETKLKLEDELTTIITKLEEEKEHELLKAKEAAEKTLQEREDQVRALFTKLKQIGYEDGRVGKALLNAKILESIDVPKTKD